MKTEIEYFTTALDVLVEVATTTHIDPRDRVNAASEILRHIGTFVPSPETSVSLMQYLSGDHEVSEADMSQYIAMAIDQLDGKGYFQKKA